MQIHDHTHWLKVGPIEISAAHRLPVELSEECSVIHGHNYAVTVLIESNISTGRMKTPGMMLDARKIKDYLSRFDHKLLNDLITGATTVERMAEIFGREIMSMYLDNIDAGEAEWDDGLDGARVDISVTETGRVTAGYRAVVGCAKL